MKFYYDTLFKKTENGYILKEYNVSETPLSFCCEEMKEEWLNTIGFNTDHPRHKTNSNTKSINIYEAFDEMDGIEYIRKIINYCPFCGEKIELEEKEKIELVAKKIITEKIEIEYVVPSKLNKENLNE